MPMKICSQIFDCSKLSNWKSTFCLEKYRLQPYGNKESKHQCKAYDWHVK